MSDDRRKVSIPAEVEEEIHKEARRLDRSRAWLLGLAWRVARERIRAIPDAETGR